MHSQSVSRSSSWQLIMCLSMLDFWCEWTSALPESSWESWMFPNFLFLSLMAEYAECVQKGEGLRETTLTEVFFLTPQKITKYFPHTAVGRCLCQSLLFKGCVFPSHQCSLWNNFSCLNVSSSLLAVFHLKQLKAVSFKVTWILMNYPHRKVEDLQFRVEEESITKGDLEVK